MQIKLDGVEETMLIPLCIKAEETQRPNPRMRDEKAVEMVSRIDYNFNKFKNKSFSYGGVVARTVIIDREARRYITSHPDAICINVGCGLDARFYRIDNGLIDWYDLDFPNVMALREQLLPVHDRVHRLGFSALDELWERRIDTQGRSILIIMEGLLMYFTEDEVRQLLSILARYFSGGTILAELMSEFSAKKSKYYDTVSKTSATFRWGVKNGKQVEQLCKEISFGTEWNLSAEMEKYSLLFRLLFTLPVLRNLNNSIALYHLISVK